MSQFAPILQAYHVLSANLSTVIADVLTVAGSAAALIKVLQILVDTLPSHAAADTVFGKMLQLLAKVSHSKVLNAAALNPTAAHAAQVTK